MRVPTVFQATLIFAAILSVCGGVSAAPGDVLHIQRGNVYLRPAPSTHSGVLMRLRRGQTVTELERRDGWVRVATFGVAGEQGWIQGAFVGPNPPRAQPHRRHLVKRTR